MLNGSPADDDLVTALSSLEVEENADLPGALLAKLAVSRTADGDLDFPSDSRLAPFANLAVVAARRRAARTSASSTATSSRSKLHLETGVTAATLEVWAQDASWLMNLDGEGARVGRRDRRATSQSSIFGDYGITPSGDNTNEDSPAHTEDGHTLMQRASDIQFLRTLARRNGKLCRVFCTDTPGDRTGYFAMPDLAGDTGGHACAERSAIRRRPGRSTSSGTRRGRPRSTRARRRSTDSDEDGVSGDSTDSGLALLDARGLGDFTGKTIDGAADRDGRRRPTS